MQTIKTQDIEHICFVYLPYRIRFVLFLFGIPDRVRIIPIGHFGGAWRLFGIFARALRKLFGTREVSMDRTGIVRRMDELGRIVIPKEIRRVMRLEEGEEMEIFPEGDQFVVRKHSRFPLSGAPSTPLSGCSPSTRGAKFSSRRRES